MRVTRRGWGRERRSIEKVAGRTRRGPNKREGWQIEWRESCRNWPKKSENRSRRGEWGRRGGRVNKKMSR